MLAFGARLAGVVRWHGQHLTALKRLLVGQLSPELVPALIQNTPVQARLGLDVHARFFLIVWDRNKVGNKTAL